MISMETKPKFVTSLLLSVVLIATNLLMNEKDATMIDKMISCRALLERIPAPGRVGARLPKRLLQRHG